ncbi:hypothetical protein HKX48_007141 [Thoreauomyces humboldtii]|nr:hypothetical protein HKX48_007141 [Thoreauomyces humboldtii]
MIPIRHSIARLSRQALIQGRRSEHSLSAHTPVLLEEAAQHVLAGSASSLSGRKLFVDATFGNGGYSRRLLDSVDCKVLAIDQDPEAYERCVAMAAEPQYADRLVPIKGRFSDLVSLVAPHGGAIDGILFDIGVSSNQLDTASRGFSIRHDGPLDMRMQSRGDLANDSDLSDSITAEAVVNGYAEHALADVIFQFGEERQSRRIARAIVSARTFAPITTTHQLARIVARAVRGDMGKHPALRTFQALRIHVNDELGEWSRGLCAAERVLKPGAPLVAVTFHSLEDRIVKNFLKDRARGGERTEEENARISPGVPDWTGDDLDLDRMRRRGANAEAWEVDKDRIRSRVRRERRIARAEAKMGGALEVAEEFPPSFRIVTKRAVAPTREEIGANPRSRFGQQYEHWRLHTQAE